MSLTARREQLTGSQVFLTLRYNQDRAYLTYSHFMSGADLGKNIWGAWPLIIWEATTAKRNYYRTN